jgi:hypothetical protein
MGAYLSRKYHYLLCTEKGFALSPVRKSEVGHAITDFKNETEADLPEWVQRLIKDTEHDPAAVDSRSRHAHDDH